MRKRMFIIIILIAITGMVIGGFVMTLKQVKSYENSLSEKIEAIQKSQTELATSIGASIESLTNSSKQMDKRIAALVLNSKTPGDLEQAQELLRLILETHHDLDVLIQAMLTQQLLRGDVSQLQWIIGLDRLTPQDKLNFQRIVEKRVTWSEILGKIQASCTQAQPSLLWGAAQKLGIRVESTASPQFESLNTLQNLIEQGAYEEACMTRGSLEGEDDIEAMLNDLCSANQFVTQYWKTIEN